MRGRGRHQSQGRSLPRGFSRGIRHHPAHSHNKGDRFGQDHFVTVEQGGVLLLRDLVRVLPDHFGTGHRRRGTYVRGRRCKYCNRFLLRYDRGGLTN